MAKGLVRFRYLIILVVLMLLGIINYHFVEFNQTVASTVPRIAILTVLQEASQRSKYSSALLSVECYAAIHNYTFMIEDASQYSSLCKHKDIMFKRHCIIASILEKSYYDWILFLDSDIGVVNPNKTIEQYAHQTADIIFYDRFFNFEVMAGSYFVRRSIWSVNFLRRWADYEFRLPKSFHGSDNGAIHAYLAEVMAPNSLFSGICQWFWEKSTNYGKLGLFEACVRKIINKAKNEHIVIMEKGTGWARDGWLTNSKFSLKRDFMFHGRKEKDKRAYKVLKDGTVSFYGAEYFGWFDHLRSPLNMSKCKEGNANWDFDPLLTSTSDQINQVLKKRRTAVDKKFKTTIQSIGKTMNDLFISF